MEIKLQTIPVKDLVKGYTDDAESGCVAYSKKLDVRPKFQREFVYKEAQRNAVIETIKKEFPLNVMYWVDNGNRYEVLDGQQRTISICEYVVGNFSLDNFYFHNLTDVEQEQILNYELMVYFCTGNDKEKLEWFKTINIAGEKLTDQELRNAVYTGSWLVDAKKHFSKSGCPAYGIANKYMNGTPIRQDYLETALKWISKNKIEEYMSKNQNEPNANELWLYFNSVINWVQAVFKVYRKEMKGLDYGELYSKYRDAKLNSDEIEIEINRLLKDEDVTNKKGIYIYVLTRDEKYLSIRTFSDKQKSESYEKQEGICPICKEHFDISEMEADHILPWSKGGKTVNDNCQMLCKMDNRTKSNK